MLGFNHHGHSPHYGHWGVPALIISLCFLIGLCGDAGRAVFAYQPSFVTEQEPWRALTGHLAHLGLPHFLLNAAGLIGVWSLYGQSLTWRRWSAVFLVCCLGISACFYVFDRGLTSYVGLSAVLHGLLSAGAVQSVLSRGRAGAGIALEDVFVLAALTVKVTYEQINGAVPFTQTLSGGAVIINAHLYGAVIGAILGGGAFLIRGRTP